jgi:hypothetical protein
MPDNSVLDLMSVFYFDTFQTEFPPDLFYWIPSIVSSLLICWFLSREALGILVYTNLSFFLGWRNTSILFQLSYILSALFLGLIFYLPNPENCIRLPYLALALFAYPITTYLYLRILYKFSIVDGQTMFPALLLLLLLYIARVLAIAFKSRSSKKVPWTVIVFTLGLLLFPIILHNRYFSIIPALPLPDITGTFYGSAQYWAFTSRMSVNNTIDGLVFGLIIGAVLGLLNQRKVQQATPQI